VRYRVLSPWTIAAWATLIVLVGAGMAVWLLLAYTGGDSDANRVQLDAIRTAGTIVVGAGGAAALLLAARRQRSTEIALKQKDRDQADAARTHALQERTALANEADAAARRITDLYTKAVEQLGSEKAPVRLGGLYALERLAQDHVEQRQTIVNVLCAYLRMPYSLPGDPPDTDAHDMVLAVYQERVQEREVRLAAQRILAHHLRPGDPDNPVETFWTDIDIDLTGCQTRTATFTHTNFTGDASFKEALFAGDASFTGAQFTGPAFFDEVRFTGDAPFDAATFADNASFTEVTFANYASFTDATFARATFYRATFIRDTSFNAATFTSFVFFQSARFASRISFDKVQFPGLATFDKAEFTGDTSFSGAEFAGTVPPEVAPFWSRAVSVGQQEGDATPTKG
jgi:hypothetical protein